ncbi:MAG TPA: universal stress protein [Kofleriaceae bacterium]|nr:universal stress protein [Kofleriaceae bacterium]
MLRKLLCATDFSPGSEHALGLAARIAAETSAELVVAHVWHVPPIGFDDYPVSSDALQQMLADVDRELAAAAARARAFGVAHVSTRVLDGVPWTSIVDAARDDASLDLIVIGTRGRTGFTRWVLGSVAEHVVRSAPCSVLVARGRGEHTPFAHVACAVDFSEQSREAVRQAAQLAAPGLEGLSLVHVVQRPELPRADIARELVVDLDRRAGLELERWAAAIEPRPRVAVRCDVRVGDPASEVLAAVEADDTIDLIAVGSRGRTGLQRMLLGSVAEKIVRNAPVPVLVARRRP